MTRLRNVGELPAAIRRQLQVVKIPSKKRSIGGIRPDLGMYFRSRWEANFARYLNFLKSEGDIFHWEYEPDTFQFSTIKRGVRFYTPDFKVWNSETSVPHYYEIKGWMDPKSKTRLNRMEKFYPLVNLILVDKKAYNSIAKNLKGFLPHWES